MCQFVHEDKEKLNQVGRMEGNRMRQNPSSQNGECRFFNRIGGCRNGNQCTFSHRPKEACKLGINCSENRCPFSHQLVNMGNNSNVNFPQASIQPKPPENMSNLPSVGVTSS